MGVEQSHELVAYAGELGDLVVDLGESAAQKAVGVSTRALTPIHDLEQFLDVVESEADALGAADEAEPVHERRVIDPIPAVAADRHREQSAALVVADSVG